MPVGTAEDRVLALPSLPADDRLRVVLADALRAAGVCGPPEAPRADAWDAAFFDLDRTTAWQGATPAQRRVMLTAAGRGLLEEAYYIEKCGMAYAARMSLLARSLEERALYDLFAADEARHLMAIRGWLAGDAIGPPSTFHTLLEDVYTTADRAGAVLIVQVLLEGWGLRHYRELGKACADPDLGALFRGIIGDEVRHHGSGVMLFTRETLDAAGTAAVVALLSRFLMMVRAGPQGVLAAIEAGIGPMVREDRVRTLRELDSDAHSAGRLAVLRRLLCVPGAEGVVAALDAADLFTPLPAEAVA